MNYKIKKAVHSRPVDYLILIGNIFMLSLFFWILLESVNYWIFAFPHQLPLNPQMFYVGVGIAVIVVLGQIMDSRIKVIIQTLNHLGKKGGKNGRQRRRKTS